MQLNSIETQVLMDIYIPPPITDPMTTHDYNNAMKKIRKYKLIKMFKDEDGYPGIQQTIKGCWYVFRSGYTF